MQFGYTILYVRDVVASLTFYEQAFGLQRRMLHETDYAELETGATRLAFAHDDFVREMLALPFETARLEGPPAAMEIALLTDDVPAAYQRALAAGAVALKPPASKPWGQVVAYVRDLNGFTVELCTPMP